MQPAGELPTTLGWVPLPPPPPKRGDCVPPFKTSYEVKIVGNSLTGSGLALVSQAEFARMKRVSRKTVTEWKNENRLVFDGKLVDVAASQAALLRNSSGRSAGKRAPVTQAAGRAAGNTSDGVTGNTARYTDGADYGNPANLPDPVLDVSLAISSGAYDFARLLRPHMPMPMVKALVAAWVEAQRNGYVGGPGKPETIADVDWPAPPIGFSHWCHHPYFTDDPLPPAEWEDLEGEYAAGRLPKVTA